MDDTNRAVSPSDVPAGQWFTPARFILLLVLLTAAAFPDVLFGNQTFIYRDFGLFSYPAAFYHRECFWNGEAPLWNPLSNCGMPFLAQWNTITLYPLSLFYLLLPLEWSLSAFCLLHLGIAGLGMYVLAMRWVQNGFAASVAGLGFAFNGIAMNFLMWPSHIATLSWMPWVIWAVERAWREGGTKLVLAVLLGSLQMLAGGPETILFTWLILAGMWLFQAWRSEQRWKVLCRFPLVVLLVGGMCAAQLIPFLELLQHSQRNPGYGAQTWAMPPWGWANLVVPLFRNRLFREGVYFQQEQGWTSSYYLGIGILALAGYAAVCRIRDRRVLALAALTLFGLLMALGKSGLLYGAFRKVLPQIGFMNYPIKFVLLAVLTLPLLAAFGVQHFVQLSERDKKAPRRSALRLGLFMLGLVIALLVLAKVFPRADEVWSATLKSGLTRAALLVVLLGALVLGHELAKSQSRLLLQLAVLVVVWLDILTFAPRQTATCRRGLLEPGWVRLDPQPQHGTSRAFITPEAYAKMMFGTSGNPEKDFAFHRQGLFLNSNFLENTPTLNGFFSLYLAWDEPVRKILTADQSGAVLPATLADFYGVSQQSKPGEIFKFVPRSTFMPMITAGQQPVFETGQRTLEMLHRPYFNPRETVYLPPESQSQVTVRTKTQAKVSNPKISRHRIDFQAEADQPALIVLSQAFYHPWQATVNGRQTVIHRANYAFQALEIPAGRSQVTLVYRDSGFRLGLAITGISLLICAAIALLTRRQTRTETPVQSHPR